MSELTHVAPTRKKSPKTTLEVRIGSQVLRGKVALNVFIAALQAMGLEQVATVDVRVCGQPLVSKFAPPSMNSPSRSYKKIDGWFIITHSSTREKKAVLEQVAQKLRIPLEVTIRTHDELLEDILDDCG